MAAQNLKRVVDDLDFLHLLPGISAQRRQSLREAVAELRGVPALIAERDALATEVARLRRQGGPSAALPATISPSL